MRRWLVLLVCITALTYAASATDIYNNLGATSYGADSISGFGPLYDSFSTGASGFNLAQVRVKLNYLGDGGGTFTIGLYADDNTSPGAFLGTVATVNDSSLAVGLHDYYFYLPLPVALAPDTRYWIGLNSSDSGAMWSWSLDTSGVGVAGEYFANTYGVQTNENGPYQMMVSDVAVPEPGTLALMLTGFAGVAGTLRRRLF